MVSGGYRCDMCDKSIDDIRWHCEVCDDVDLCSECRDRGGITGALLEQGHRTTHPLTRIVQRRNPPTSNEGSRALLNQKKTFVAITESNKKLISAIVEDICDPTRTSAAKGLSALLGAKAGKVVFHLASERIQSRRNRTQWKSILFLLHTLCSCVHS